MEILINKTLNKDSAYHYDGVIAYGKAIDGNAYVLRVQPKIKNPNINKWFVICRAEQTEINEIFKKDDETGQGLMFDYYDDAILGFEKFLETDCNIFK